MRLIDSLFDTPSILKIRHFILAWQVATPRGHSSSFFCLVAALMGASAASIVSRRYTEMTVNSTQGFYDLTNNIPYNEAAPEFELPPLVVCSNNCTLDNSFFN
ncbi:hypothetical protein HMPREF1544_09984 [Mucor circinelloides 1006PhL]|uniref:Uncharacterized protein n=1 Tax=Mucor circinelloides f. circinelloides (strain 1006PhL) TaxID=1220926 RepID=S2J132_MUCC1|nr:hypothetical protein HMPREF1544_09984 [Mucor circinelloides 1006PhL]